jgi:hypothetical protein
MLKKRFRNDVELVEELINLGIIKAGEEEEEISIDFLDEQYEMLSEAREKRRKAGSKGGKQSSGKAQAKSKQSSSYKDKDKDKDKDINIPFEDFWNEYAKKVGDKKSAEKKWCKLSDKDRKKIMDFIPGWKKTITDKQYQPYPTTFLNQRRWENEDELSQAEKKKELTIEDLKNI